MGRPSQCRGPLPKPRQAAAGPEVDHRKEEGTQEGAPHFLALACAAAIQAGVRCCPAQAPHPGSSEGPSSAGASASASAAFSAAKSATTSSPANARATSSRWLSSTPAHQEDMSVHVGPRCTLPRFLKLLAAGLLPHAKKMC